MTPLHALRCAATAALLLLVCASATEAQSRSRVWVAAGLGGGGSSDADGMAVIGQLVYQKAPHHLALHGAAVVDPFGVSGDAMEHAALLYGRTLTRRFGHVAIATGIAAAAFESCAGESGSCAAVGLPIVVEAALTGRFIGIGLQAFGNINSRNSFGGITVLLPVGWLP